MEMSDFEQRLWGYLVTHKTPVTVKKMAKYWICSESRVRSALDKFVAGEIAEVVRLGNLKHYRIKE
jgi:MarR-like DNA-binding transcriptional regulator SgrR of sgrS sRNA